MRFLAKVFHYCDFYDKPNVEKVFAMKYFGQKESLAKYLANAKFG